MKYLIGIDIGTGSTKAIAVNLAGEMIHTTQVSYPILNPEPGFSEQAPELIWQAFVKCTQRIVTFLNEDPEGIALSSAMHSIIPVDMSGKPLMNMITWADNRSADVAEKIKKSDAGKRLYEQTGTPLHAMSPLCKIIWLKDNRKELFAQVSKYISIKEYIWHKLFNTYEVDHSIASATGLFDIRNLSWSTHSLDACAIRVGQLSKPVPVDYKRQDISQATADDMGIPASIPFIIGASDGCLANLGSFAIEPGVAALTIGTSGALRVANKVPTPNFEAMIFNYCLFDDLFISGGPINNGGIALKWYAECFLKIKLSTPEDYETLLGEVKNVAAGAEGVIFLPYLLGERAPIWNSNASASFFGLKNGHTQAHLTRAVIEGISMALYSILEAMEKSGLNINKMHVSGGFVHSNIWLQILADVFNKQIYLIHEEDASAIGAAYLGLKSLGFIKDFTEIKPALKKSYVPNQENHHIHKKTFAVYKRLYGKLKDEMR